MTSKVEVVDDILTPEKAAYNISTMWLTNNMLRKPWMDETEEIRSYIYATDTSHTTNRQNPWKNKTTIPKLCQISDNLEANYKMSAFPKKKWLIWEANNQDSNSINKRDAITNYMDWVISQPSFKEEMDKIILDYIHYGNAVATVEWIDERAIQPDKTQTGYIGPGLRRISPLDIVVNPTAESWHRSPKVVRSLLNIGEVKELLERMSNDENRAEYEELWKYLKDIRGRATSYEGDWVQKDSLYSVDGFGSFRDYLKSGTAEILTFYGDIYDEENDEFLKNYVITVVDRHKIIGKKPNPSFFGYPPIFHAPWRKRQDNLWGMSPLANLVGMQYRLDHVENMKADIYDLTTYPVHKIKGFVEDFTWQPGEKIYVSDEGDVEMHVPDVNALQANFELQSLEAKMEEMAGAPKEAMGFRSPGEKTKYEVQRLENAASRIFQNRIRQFEEQIIEPVLNAMLELAKRNMTGVNSIKVFDDEFKVATFQDLTVEDITGIGRLKPIAARHFAEQSELVQNITNLTASNLWPIIQPHTSSKQMVKLVEDMFNMHDYNVFMPWAAIAEQAEAQKMMQSTEEDVAQHTMTATGMGDDFDIGADQQLAMADQMAQGAQPE